MSLTLASNMEFLGEAGVQILLGVLMECAQEKIRNRLARFARFVWFEVRDRTGTRFRYYLWCGDTTFKDRYPELFIIARNRDAKVTDYMEVI